MQWPDLFLCQISGPKKHVSLDTGETHFISWFDTVLVRSRPILRDMTLRDIVSNITYFKTRLQTHFDWTTFDVFKIVPYNIKPFHYY